MKKITTAPNPSPAAKFRAEALAAVQAEANRQKLSTEELANVLRIKPQTIRAGLCRNSHYLGLKPLKLANGKLLWDTEKVARLLSGEVS